MDDVDGGDGGEEDGDVDGDFGAVECDDAIMGNCY